MNAIDYNYLCQQLASGGRQAMEQIFLSEGFQEKKLRSRKRGNQARLYPQHPFPATTVPDNDVLTLRMLLSDVSIHRGTHRAYLPLYIEEKRNFILR